MPLSSNLSMSADAPITLTSKPNCRSSGHLVLRPGALGFTTRKSSSQKRRLSIVNSGPHLLKYYWPRLIGPVGGIDQSRTSLVSLAVAFLDSLSAAINSNTEWALYMSLHLRWFTIVLMTMVCNSKSKLQADVMTNICSWFFLVIDFFNSPLGVDPLAAIARDGPVSDQPLPTKALRHNPPQQPPWLLCTRRSAPT